MLRVLVVRHGQSEWNALGRWQGQADPPLSELGRLQAAHAAGKVGSIDAVVASDLERSRDTATIIAELTGIGPVIVDEGFRERDAGEWQGLTKAEIEAGWPGWLADRRRPPAFEPEEGFRGRVQAALDRVRELVPDGDVLVVAHAGVVYQLEAAHGAAFLPLPNLAGRWFESGASGWHLGERLLLVEADEVTVPGAE